MNVYITIGCWGYINSFDGDDGAIVSISPSKSEIERQEYQDRQDDQKNSSIWDKYPDQCFWFIEASHVNGTLVLTTSFDRYDSITVS